MLAAREEGAAASLATFAGDDEAIARWPSPCSTRSPTWTAWAVRCSARCAPWPLPSSPGGRLWRAAELVREHRGDGHLAAAVALGFEAPTLNVLTELWLGFAVGEYSGTRGMSADAQAAAVGAISRGVDGWRTADSPTPAGRRATALEAATDVSQQALVDALGPSIEGIIERGRGDLRMRSSPPSSFPTDPRKRAGG